MKKSRRSRRIIAILCIAAICLLTASLIGIFCLQNESFLPKSREHVQISPITQQSPVSKGDGKPGILAL